MVKKIIVIFLLLSSSFNIYSQEPADLLNATVINDDGDVKLTWQRRDTIDANLIISRDYYDAGDWVVAEIKQINDRDITSWVDTNTNANTKTHIYKLSYSKVGLGSIESNYFNTIHTSLEFDTCNKIVSLLWTRHIDEPSWKDFNDTISIKAYNIWRQTDSNAPVKIETITNGDTTFYDNKVDYNHTYKYFVEGVRKADTSIKSRSNRLSIRTKMPSAPNYINTDKLRTGENEINLFYSIAENSELNIYKLLRSKNYEGPFDTLDTFNTQENIINYSDEGINPNKNIYYYSVVGINKCNHLSTQSDTLNNIILKVENNDVTNNLSWNGLEPKKPRNYEITRKIGKGIYSGIYTTTELNFNDNELRSFRGTDTSGMFCYYIKGILKSSEDRESIILSNKKCIYIKPRIFIPEAFTPNGDNKNDEFRPIFSFLPQHYLLKIYNRDGRIVFESRVPVKSWKGLIQGNTKAPAGTYIYYLEVKNPDDETIKRRGQINVFYP